MHSSIQCSPGLVLFFPGAQAQRPHLDLLHRGKGSDLAIVDDLQRHIPGNLLACFVGSGENSDQGPEVDSLQAGGGEAAEGGFRSTEGGK